MLRKVRMGLEYALGKDRVTRDLRVSAADAFIISYPGSGATWLQSLLADFVQAEGPTISAGINSPIIDTDIRSRRYIRNAPRPAIFNTHQWFHGAYKKVLYLVRDPRDVVLGRFRLRRDLGQIDGAHAIERYVSGFLAGDESDVGTWCENVLSWLATRYMDPEFRLLRYEDLYENTKDELAKAAGFLCIRSSGAGIARAMERGSNEGMPRLKQSKTRKGRERRQNTTPPTPVVPGQWRTDLPGKCVTEIENAWGPLMKTVGYELSVADRPKLQLPFNGPARASQNLR
jgi:Sulfotransferase domain